MKVAYVFFNGDLNGKIDFYKNFISQEKGDIFCADGGSKHLEKLGLIPLEIWGDLDSTTDEILKKYKNNNVIINKFPVNKDYTDGELLISYLSKSNYDKIIIIAGLGGRIDHTLTNLNLMLKFKKMIFITETEKIFLIDKKEVIKDIKDKTISFIPFSDEVENLTLEGFEYELKNTTIFKKDSRCMSNRATSNVCKVEFENGKLLAVIITK